MFIPGRFHPHRSSLVFGHSSNPIRFSRWQFEVQAPKPICYLHRNLLLQSALCPQPTFEPSPSNRASNFDKSLASEKLPEHNDFRGPTHRESEKMAEFQMISWESWEYMRFQQSQGNISLEIHLSWTPGTPSSVALSSGQFTATHATMAWANSCGILRASPLTSNHRLPVISAPYLHTSLPSKKTSEKNSR